MKILIFAKNQVTCGRYNFIDCRLPSPQHLICFCKSPSQCSQRPRIRSVGECLILFWPARALSLALSPYWSPRVSSTHIAPALKSTHVMVPPECKQFQVISATKLLARQSCCLEQVIFCLSSRQVWSHAYVLSPPTTDRNVRIVSVSV